MSEQLGLELEPPVSAPTPVVAAAAEPDVEQVEMSRRCGGRFDWHGRPLRCEQPSRHAGWHTTQPRRGARVKWNDAGSYESVEPSVSAAKRLGAES